MLFRSRPGDGTRFSIYLPAGDAAVAAAPAEAVCAAHAATTGTVLVVDDEGPVREVAGMVLQRAGYAVMLAVDGADGVAQFEAHAGELAAVILDLTMPTMSGEEALRRMRDVRPDIPVVVTTGLDEGDARSRFADSETAVFIQKPYRPGELLVKLRDVIDRPA